MFEINSAFAEPFGYRFEFPSAPLSGGRETIYLSNGSPTTKELKEEEALRYKKVLLAFDWNHVENPVNPEVITLVPDDISVLFRARLGGIYHEARLGLSTSSDIDKLLHDLDLIK